MTWGSILLRGVENTIPTVPFLAYATGVVPYRLMVGFYLLLIFTEVLSND